MNNCIYCEKEYKNKRAQSAHQSLCKHNPNRREPSLAGVHAMLAKQKNFSRESDTHYECKFCKSKPNSLQGLASHTRWCDANPNKTSRNKCVEKVCSTCSDVFYDRSKRNLRKTCSDKCAKVVSDETKAKISEKRKKYLAENKESHVWKRKDKFKSVPCEKLKEILTGQGINFCEEFMPLPNRSFSIDIAFPHIKLGIEVNGNQHYNQDGALAPYYQERHDLITASGWTLLEIPYNKVYNNDFITYIQNIINDPSLKLPKEFYKPYLKPYLKSKPISKLALKLQQDIEKLELLKKSTINFKKYGWATKASLIIGVRPEKVTCWLKRMDAEFFATCYSRSRKL